MIQKSGVCIGSCLAPVLSGIYFSFVDRAIEGKLRDAAPDRVFRFLDDYLIIHPRSTAVEVILPISHKTGGRLNFKNWSPSGDRFSFLDLRLTKEEDGICWAYQQPSVKPVLSFKSAHSKSVKLGIIAPCLHQRNRNHANTSLVKA